MTYVTVITLVAYALLVLLLAATSIVDARTRRIPNGLVATMAALWVAWRVVLGFAGRHTGIGFMTGLISPAPEVPLPLGVTIAGESLAGGLIGALVLGGGLLVVTAVFEALTRREAFGGGDIKLLAALGLFLGWERGLLCVLVACVFSVIYALMVALFRQTATRLRGDGRTPAAQLPNPLEVRDVSAPEKAAGKDAINAPEREVSTFAGTTLPFGPFIALGTLIAFAS